jgi:hypothetical protein
MINLLLLTFILLLLNVNCNNEKINAIVTLFDSDTDIDIQKSLLLFRSLWSYNNNLQYDIDNNIIEAHACINSINKLTNRDINIINIKFNKIGVKIHVLNNISSLFNLNNNQDNNNLSNNIVCNAQIASYYYNKAIYDANILFIGIKYLIVGDLRNLFFNQMNNINSNNIYCLPKLIPIDYALDKDPNGICNLDILLFQSHLGIEISSIINATVYSKLSPSDILSIITRTITSGIVLFNNVNNIIHAGRVWNSGNIDINQIPLIEFDGKEHIISVENCMLYIHIEWPKLYNTGNKR